MRARITITGVNKSASELLEIFLKDTLRTKHILSAKSIIESLFSTRSTKKQKNKLYTIIEKNRIS
ncbi:hypothetical protein EA14781_016_00580 [Escherichia albertii NBRC 107761 = DSM 17582]|nr:hypothetical protein EA14781_016_00580 [Escherichia albertii NBRC 107761 = DSM 17582]